MRDDTRPNLTASALRGVRDPRLFLAGVYVVMWFGGVITYSLYGSPPANMTWAGPAFLTLAGLLVVLTTQPRQLFAPLLAAIIGFTSEVVGVATGTIYSGYSYSAALGPKVLDVPLAMVPAWLVLAAYVLELSRRWRVPGVTRVFVAAAWMTGIDLVIDPVAANPLGFWEWHSRGRYYGIPLHNFAGWFGVSLLFFGVARRLPYQNVCARWLGVSVVAFFAVVAFAFGFVIPGLIGIALIVLDLIMSHLASASGRHLRGRQCASPLS